MGNHRHGQGLRQFFGNGEFDTSSNRTMTVCDVRFGYKSFPTSFASKPLLFQSE
ncbi:MAG: hypothetical protein L0L34_04960 [Enterococcus sp.]|nr:hypothetical protein [Enterococcus sp.]MDN6648320.1 hypothetical protein [Enterococcus sp.]